MQIAVVSAQRHLAHTRLTVRSAATVVPDATFHVLDVDGSYVPVARERVLTPQEVGVMVPDLHRRAVLLEPEQLVRSLTPALLRAVVEPGVLTVLLAPGVVLLDDPTAALTPPDGSMVLVSRTGSALPLDGRYPDVAAVARSGAYAPVCALHTPLPGLLELWEEVTPDPALQGDRWLDAVSAMFPHVTVRDASTLVSAWTLRDQHHVTGAATTTSPLLLDGRRVTALDLSALDPAAPWLLDPSVGDPRARLSDHPALADVVARLAAELRADVPGERSLPSLTTTALGFPVDATFRSLFRSLPPGATGVPDPLDARTAPALLDYLTTASVEGGLGRYLRALHATRPDLCATFPRVPGSDEGAFLAWVDAHAIDDGYPAVVVEEAVRRVRAARRTTRRTAAGVNVIGYLRGELGIGESARLMIAALDAARVPHAPVAVDRHLASRQGVRVASTNPRPPVFDTSLICVNADLTPSVAGTVPEVLDRSYRIGMWYWEVEDFPRSQHGGFAHVDEVWVATDFVRRAIEPHSPVPVRTVTPPLPQRGPDPTLTRADLGLPDRPLFLFSFDFLSTAERKNPWGLVDAFTEAFAPGEGPVLLIKSINADQRPSEAERLRLRAASAPDVLLMENYLDPAERDALVALCDCYVSLHRSEGLGLTMAEAMAWGKPVIATGYSGNLQFMTEQNSYLVPWSPTEIPAGAEPYPAGGTWAEPDLHAAAQLMRSVLDDPAEAAARGARAASDIAQRHSAEVAGRMIATRLEEAAPRRRARARSVRVARLRSTVRRRLG